MTRSKKIFTVVALLFFAFLVGLIIDISRKTTFPGKKKPSQELQEGSKGQRADTAKSALSPKSAVHQP